jgi:hypothetical protein
MAASPINLRSNKVDALTTQSQNFHGRRITNAANAVNPQDYVTLSQLNAAIAGIQQNVDKSTTNINNSTTVTSTAVVQLITLSSNLVITPSISPVVNGVLIIILTQNGTGGWIPTWSSAFSIVPTDINTVANKRTAIVFATDVNTKWMMVGAPMLET